jgi:hypothetical protein
MIKTNERECIIVASLRRCEPDQVLRVFSQARRHSQATPSDTRSLVGSPATSKRNPDDEAIRRRCGGNRLAGTRGLLYIVICDHTYR